MLDKIKSFFGVICSFLSNLFSDYRYSLIAISVLISSLISGVLTYKILIPRFISSNGELIIKSVEEMYKKKEEEGQKEGLKNVDSVYTDIISDSQLPFIGNRNGSKIVIEFFDYACGHCKHQSSELKKLIASDRNVKVIFIDFPILSQGSFVASNIAIYLFNKHPEKFLGFYETIISSPQIDQKIVESALTKIGLNKNALAQEMQKDQISREVLQRNHQRATLLKLRGTPALVIKGKIIPGYLSAEDLSKLF